MIDPQELSIDGVLRWQVARSRRRALVVAALLVVVLTLLGINSEYVITIASPVAAVDAGAPVDAGAAVDAGAPACASFASCDAECGPDRAGLVPCVRAADFLRTGRGGATRDVAAARTRYRSICRATRDAAACTRLALLTGLLEDLAVAPDWIDPYAAPHGLLIEACRSGGDRGALACAAIAAFKPWFTEVSFALYDRAAAEAVARTSCEQDGLPEACYVAAVAATTNRVAAAHDRLGKACEVDRDPTACTYLWISTGLDDPLLRACSDSTSEPAVARACLGRAEASRSRKAELTRRACALGSCQGVTKLTTLLDACEAGQLNACANALGSDDGLAAAARLAPDVDLTADVPAALRASYGACRYGAARACDDVIAKLPATSASQSQLKAYAARLRAPLTAP